jgi:hypothetical protein
LSSIKESVNNAHQSTEQKSTHVEKRVPPTRSRKSEKAGPSYKVAEGSVIDLDWREGEDARVLEPSSTCVLFKLLHLQAASKALAPEKRVEADLRGEAGG